MKSEWKECKISDLGAVISGATPSTKRSENYEGGTISWITPKDLSNFSGRFISHGERNITDIGLKSCSAQLMPKNTILFSSRAPIGYIAIASQELCTNQGFKSVVSNDETDFMFLYYLLKHYKNDIEHMGSGTTFKEVSGNVMKNITVCVPASKKEQQKIASILSSLDDKIELNNRINENLEAQIRSIYTQLSKEILGEAIMLSEVLDIRDGTHDSPKFQKEGFPLVTSKHLLPFGVNISNANLISKEDYEKINKRSKVETYDTLISMIGL